MSAPQLSRRTLARVAVWAVPTVALSVAAPAIAASPPVQPTLEWSRFGTDGAGKLDGEQAFDTVTATLSHGGNTRHQDTFTSDLGCLRLRSNVPTALTDIPSISQTLSLQFSEEVRDLSFTVFSLDRHEVDGVVRFEDRIHFSSTPPTSYVLGSEVVGDGRERSWFRMNPDLPGGDATGRPDQSDRDLYKVELHWSVVPADATITMEYSQGNFFGRPRPTPTIWLSNPTFCA